MSIYLKSCPRCGGNINCDFDQDSTLDRVKGFACINCGFSPSDRKDYYSPMLAKLTHAFDDPEYYYEPKYDGIRCIAYTGTKSVKYVNRSGNDITERFPEIRVKTNYPVVIDGELVCLDENRVPNFQLMQTRMNRITDIAEFSAKHPATYYVFDIMAAGRWDITSLSLARRKQLIDEYVVFSDNVKVTPYVQENGIALFKALSEQKWEGIMAKRIISPYIVGDRSILWQKIKAIKQDVFTVVGATFGWGKRENTFGALIVAAQANQYLFHIGEVGTGFTDHDLLHLSNLLEPLKTTTPPIDDLPRGMHVQYWVEPKVKIKVAFQELTNKNKLRHPSFQGLAN